MTSRKRHEQKGIMATVRQDDDDDNDDDKADDDENCEFIDAPLLTIKKTKSRYSINHLFCFL